MNGDTHYAEPPQIPSRAMRNRTAVIASPSEPTGTIPMPDSSERSNNMKNCTIAGRDNNRSGRGGIPREIDERERKTVAW